MSHSNLTGLTLYNFRNFAHKSLSFNSPLIIITGPNGAGKTSVLEATGYSFSAHSFLGAKPDQLIKNGAEQAFVSMALDLVDGSKTITNIGWSREGEKNIKVDNQAQRKHRELAKLLCPQAITQDDLGLITGSPERRRLFLNQLQLLLDSQGASLWRDYKRAVVQRNAMLDSGATSGVNSDVFAQWTGLVCKFGAQIQAWRQNILKALEPILQEKIKRLALKKLATLAYWPKIDLQGIKLEEVLGDKKLQAKELAMGHTMFGPHLDDFQIMANGMDTKHFASRGETKLILIALKCAALEVAMASGYSNNLLLIDDLITDLDENNLKRGLDLILSLDCQTIVTSPTHNVVSLPTRHFQHVEL